MKLYNILNEYEQNDKTNNKLEQIKNLYKSIKDYAYIDGNKQTVLNMKSFENKKGGICFDYTNYIYHKLSNLRPMAYFIEFIDKNSHQVTDTHTFPMFLIDNKYVVLEAAFKPFAGVHIFNSEKQMVDFYIKNMKKKEKTDIAVFNYKPKNVNTTVDNFITDINNNSKELIKY